MTRCFTVYSVFSLPLSATLPVTLGREGGAQGWEEATKSLGQTQSQNRGFVSTHPETGDGVGMW